MSAAWQSWNVCVCVCVCVCVRACVCVNGRVPCGWQPDRSTGKAPHLNAQNKHTHRHTRTCGSACGRQRWSCQRVKPPSLDDPPAAAAAAAAAAATAAAPAPAAAAAAASAPAVAAAAAAAPGGWFWLWPLRLAPPWSGRAATGLCRAHRPTCSLRAWESSAGGRHTHRYRDTHTERDECMHV